MVSAAKLEANRRNAEKSTGPRTEEGKSRIRYNALMHGMTAESAILPGEDAAAFVDRLRSLLDDLQPRNQLEAQAIERIARDAWLSDRADRAVAAGLSARLRHLAVDSARAEHELTLELGQRLLRNLARPFPLGPHDDPSIAPYYCRYITLGTADHPARLVLRLESTIAGCDWLLERWGELAHRISVAGLWQASDGFTTIRLIGKLACDVADDREVAVVMLSTVALTIKPEPKLDPEMEDPDDDDDDDDEAYMDVAPDPEEARKARIDKWCMPFAARLSESPLSALGPANPEEARRWLSKLAAAHIKRLRLIRAQNHELAAADLAGAPARLAMEPGAEGDRQRRYVLSRDRSFHRSVDTFLKTRQMSESGKLDRVDIENPVLPDAPANGPVPVMPDQPGKRPEIIPLPSVRMLDWCDGGVPTSDLAEVGEIEPVADPAPPRDEPALAQTPEDADPALPRDEAGAAQHEEQVALCDDEAFFRNEPTPDPEAERAEVRTAIAQLLPALLERAMKLEAEREAGAAAERSAEPEKRAHPFDPLVPASRPLDEASPPALPKLPDPRATGVAIEPVAGSPRAP